MTKQEFLKALGEKLSEDLPAAEVLRQIQYYEGYIDAETSRGRDEESILEELGDPILIARNVSESPITHRNSWNTQSPYEQGYVQGSYESRTGTKSTASTPAQPERPEAGDFRKETNENAFREEATINSKPDGVRQKAFLMPLILAAVLVIALIVGIVTGAVTLDAMVLPLILLAAAFVLIFILVAIRKKK